MTASRRGRTRSDEDASGGTGAARLTVGRLARQFGLSRSTLLYYHRIGVLVPSRRGHNGYRQYAPADVRRLEAIVRYRQAGVPLADIVRLLDGPDDELATVLERRLAALNAEIATLREQQRIVVGLLRSEREGVELTVMSRERWTRLLETAGFSDDDMRRWHVIFERHDPEAHHEFLRFLSIPDDEIETIRGWSRDLADGDPRGAV